VESRKKSKYKGVTRY
jgi:hypothetical protein